MIKNCLVLRSFSGIRFPTFRGFVSCQIRKKSNENADEFLNTEEHSSASDSEDQFTVDDVKHKILENSLPFVNDLGWTKETLVAGAKSVGYPGVAHGMFPKGGIELVDYFIVACNQKLVEELKTKPLTKERKKRKVIQNIQTATELRMQMLIPYIDTWSKAIAMLSLPSNAKRATDNLATLVDDIWYYSGDRTADFDWYTKRAALAGIYVATELVMVQDKSEDFKDTWDFLSRYLQYYEKTSNIVDEVPNFVVGTFTTMKNVLGLGHFNR